MGALKAAELFGSLNLPNHVITKIKTHSEISPTKNAGSRKPGLDLALFKALRSAYAEPSIVGGFQWTNLFRFVKKKSIWR